MEKKVSHIHYCMICNSFIKAKKLFCKNGHDVYLCPSCLLKYVYPQPSICELREIYSDEYYSRGNKYSHVDRLQVNAAEYQNDLQKIKLVKRYKSGGSLLDVGCALGGFLCLAQHHNYSISGVEISESSARHASNRLGIDVFCGDLISARLPSEHYDIITMWDVIEHLQSPNDILSEIKRLLRPDGILAISTGDAGSILARVSGRCWHLMTPPEHLFYFNNDNIRKLLQGRGLYIKETRYYGKYSSCEFIFLKAEKTIGSLMIPIRYFFSLFKFDKIKLYVNLGDIMTFVAGKK